MKGFTRTETRFSLCGLNCGLCSMHLGGYCPGCGGGAWQSELFHSKMFPGAQRYSILLGMSRVPLSPLQRF